MCYWRKIEYRIIPTCGYRVLRSCPGCGCKTAYEGTRNFRVNANGKRIDVWLIYQCERCGHTYNLAIYERVKPGDIPGGEYSRFLENDGETALRYGMDKSIFAKNRAEIDWEHLSYEIVQTKGEVDSEREQNVACGREEGTAEWERNVVCGREKGATERGQKGACGRGQDETTGREQRETCGQGQDEMIDWKRGETRTNLAGSSVLVIHNPFDLKIRTDKAIAEIAHLSRSKVRQLVKDGKLELPQDYIGKQIAIEIGRAGLSWEDEGEKLATREDEQAQEEHQEKS